MISVSELTDIRPFVANDMIEIVQAGVKEYGLRAKPNDEIIELAESRERNGQCITGLIDGTVMGCGGIDLMWEGVGEVWMILSTDFGDAEIRDRIKTFSIIKDGIQRLIDDNDLTRVQAWGRIGFPEAHTLFKHLGFKPEGIARKYTPDGVDCILYSIVR